VGGQWTLYNLLQLLGSHLRRHSKIRRTDVELVAEFCIPLTHWLPYLIRGQTSFKAWQIDPLIIQELPASSVATAEQIRVIAKKRVLEACDVAGPGPCDAKMVG
jgi:hypothetical protein